MSPHHWQHESLVVVGVLPDQVYSPRSAHRHGRVLLISEFLAVEAACLRHQLGNSRILAGHSAAGRRF